VVSTGSTGEKGATGEKGSTDARRPTPDDGTPGRPDAVGRPGVPGWAAPR
jgi:hypothetical protein